RSAGWTHTDRAVLEAAGDVSATFPHALATRIAPQLEGLDARLGAPGATFLDVGVAVATLAIEMARRWPALRVLGVDPLAAAVALGRERVRAAGLEARIELREQSAEQLVDASVFDLAWIPSAFIAASALQRVVDRAYAALRPGGWLLFPVMKTTGD